MRLVYCDICKAEIKYYSSQGISCGISGISGISGMTLKVLCCSLDSLGHHEEICIDCIIKMLEKKKEDTKEVQ